jgi:hypothetical protein
MLHATKLMPAARVPRERAATDGVLLSLVVLMRAVGIDEDTNTGRVVLGPIGFPILFLLFMAAFGGFSSGDA